MTIPDDLKIFSLIYEYRCPAYCFYQRARRTNYRILNKTELKVVFYIGMFTGQRLKDCVLLQWQNVDMEHHKIFVK